MLIFNILDLFHNFWGQNYKFITVLQRHYWHLKVYNYFCSRVLNSRNIRQIKEFRSFLYRYPLFYILLINICYSIDNILVFVLRKDNLLSAGADHVSPIIIVYQTIVWLFSCGLWGFSIRYLPAVLPIKG